MTVFKYKVLLIGPPAVGKTSLIYQFVKNEWLDNYAMTIGVNVLTKSVNFTNDEVKLMVWDIGGQARFKGLRKNLYFGTKGVLLIFDLTREATFKEMNNWLNEMNEILGKKVPLVLIGNKVDLIKEKGRNLNPNEAKMLAMENESVYIETSAKTGEKVEEAFKKLARLIAQKAGRTIE